MRFRKIVSVDNTGLEPWAREKLSEMANEVVFYEDYPSENSEIISRVDDADCVLVSWNTPIDREVIESCKGLKYIGMCCSLYDEKSANVDIKAAHENGINVLGIRNYGDEGVIEFILSEVIRLLHGFGKYQWHDEPLELTNQKLGIIGLGRTGKMLAERAKAFGMDVSYFSRSRKTDFEEKGVNFLHLSDLLKEADIISTHLPKYTIVLEKEEFEQFGNGKILINTSLQPTFDVPAFREWIRNEGNFAIFDKEAMGSYYEEFISLDRVIFSNIVSGWTKQAKKRLSEKVIQNIQIYFESF
ncbi:MAG TPA: NAD(P)-dependent oxidoreductase [Thermotogota bacterium]|nr:NAD(P)-dependent oxidoreductase [Thermotogota bacterium]